jgi:glycine/D-amino acid oxidase-like deaminating enzyme
MTSASRSTDLVVIGGGMVGGWASYFAATDGADVVLVERDRVGTGASSRAAGMVRAQGGMPATVKLGQWSIDFYNRQQALLGTDSGFRELGYMILATTKKDVKEGRARVEMQRAAGLDVRWVEADEAVRLNPALAVEGHRGGSYAETDGAIDPPRNVLAYSLAMQRAGVDLRERTEFLGLVTRESGAGTKVTGVRTSAGDIATERVLLTGGPTLGRVASLAGAKVFVGGARHQVVVTEPHEAFQVDRQAMVFDVRAGIYWRLEEGGLLWGMSNPKETPGIARQIDWPYLRKMQRRLHKLVPPTAGLGIRKAWAATIDYTSDHLPIFGPVVRTDGTVVEGASIASPGGHGMMWGPAVARVAADLALEGATSVIDDADSLGMDRFDEHGHSPFYDPIALPFPTSTDDD